jgi:hypothetical protein
MTINKAQGQTLEHVGLCLTEPVFTHGQLCVALIVGPTVMSTRHNTFCKRQWAAVNVERAAAQASIPERVQEINVKRRAMGINPQVALGVQAVHLCWMRL